MVFLQAIKVLKSILCLGVRFNYFSSKFSTSHEHCSVFSHTHTLRSSGHCNVFGLSAFCRSVFLSCVRPSTSVKKCDTCFWSLGLGIGSKHDHILGLTFAFPTWIMMELAQPWSKLKPNKLEIKSGIKWVIPGHQSAPGGHVLLSKLFGCTKVLVSKECSEGCRS